MATYLKDLTNKPVLWWEEFAFLNRHHWHLDPDNHYIEYLFICQDHDPESFEQIEEDLQGSQYSLDTHPDDPTNVYLMRNIRVENLMYQTENKH